MKLVVALLVAVVSLSANALEKGTIRASLLAGQVGLFGDPGRDGANGLGLGVSGGFQVSEPLAVELRYLNSSQPDVNHHDLSFGGEYAFGDFESGYAHVQLGMDFIDNSFKRGGVSYSAAGLYVGAGLDFELARELQIGPEVRLVKAFSNHGLVNGVDQTTIGDNYSVMLRLSYLFGNER